MTAAFSERVGAVGDEATPAPAQVARSRADGHPGFCRSSTEAEIHRVRGELLLSLGDIQAATASLHIGIEVARHQQAKLFELRAATRLARLWCEQGKCRQAREVLTPVYGWFAEGFDTPLLQNAKAVLDELM